MIAGPEVVYARQSDSGSTMAKNRLKKLIEPYVVTRGRNSRLKHIDPGDTAGFHPEPWVVVPGNKKWFARLVVAAALVDALDGLDLAFPKVTPAKKQELATGRRLLKL
jgi:hypothetical protein